MTALRSLAFDAGFYAWTALLGIGALPLLLGPRRLAVRVGRLWVDVALFLLARTVGLAGELRGQDRRPEAGAIYAFKHQSAWDTLVLMRLFDDPAVVVKRELMAVPVFGWYLRRLGMIPIDRRAGAAALRRMLAAARDRARRGRDIVVFPEGTRTAPGAGGGYLPGIAALYRELAVPVVPVALDSGLYWGRRALVKRPGRIVVSFLPAIEPGLDRAAFMARLEEAIESETDRLLAAAARLG